MKGFNIIMTISIILFARLGIRLVSGYKKLKQEEKEEKDKSDDKTL
ncbi:MAG: hypothetical protein ACJAS3_000621 [Roseivirga sp.]|jgi:hypothetical protein